MLSAECTPDLALSSRAMSTAVHHAGYWRICTSSATILGYLRVSPLLVLVVATWVGLRPFQLLCADQLAVRAPYLHLDT